MFCRKFGKCPELLLTSQLEIRVVNRPSGHLAFVEMLRKERHASRVGLTAVMEAWKARRAPGKGNGMSIDWD
jgi:hypothetical protein